MTKEDDEDFENSTKYWIWDNVNVEGDAKVKGHWHVTGKFIEALHIETVISFRLIIRFLSYSTT